jgi:hypothetical protein
MSPDPIIFMLGHDDHRIIRRAKPPETLAQRGTVRSILALYNSIGAFMCEAQHVDES